MRIEREALRCSVRRTNRAGLAHLPTPNDGLPERKRNAAMDSG